MEFGKVKMQTAIFCRVSTGSQKQDLPLIIVITQT